MTILLIVGACAFALVLALGVERLIDLMSGKGRKR